MQPSTPCEPESSRSSFRRKSSFLFTWITAAALAFLTSACLPASGGLPTATLFPTAAATSTQIPLPDLVIQSLAFETETPSPCYNAENLGIRVTIVNQGNAPAETFTLSVNGLLEEMRQPLQPGETVTRWFSGYEPENLAIVDIDFIVEEAIETNNTLAAQFAVPVSPPECVATAVPPAPAITPQAALQGHTAKVWSVDFSPDGRLLASGSVDNTLRLWRVFNSSLLRTMLGHPFPILTLKISPNNLLIATGSDDGLVRVWNVSNGSLLHTLRGHGGWVNSVAFSPDGNSLASASDDYTVRIWRVTDGELLQVIDEGMSRVLSVTYSPSGTALAWAESNGTVRVRQISDGKWLAILNQGNRPATSVRFSPDSELMAAGFADGSVRIWRVNDWSLVKSLAAQPGAVSSVAFSPDGKLFAAAGNSAQVDIWKVEGESGSDYLEDFPAWILNSPVEGVNSISWSPDSRQLAAALDDHTIQIWQISEP